MIPLADDTPRQHAPWVLWILAATNVAAFLFEAQLPLPELERFVTTFGLVPQRDYLLLQAGDPQGALPYLSSLFLHGSWWHLIGNLWMLWIFGDNVEDRMGPWRFALFYLLCGLVAGAMHVASDPSSPVPTVGASGAIAGVLGAYALLYPGARVLVLVPVLFYPLLVQVPALFFTMVWFAIQFAGGAQALVSAPGAGGVAWWAHIGGALAGFLLCGLFLHPRRRDRSRYLDERAEYDRMWRRLQ